MTAAVKAELEVQRVYDGADPVPGNDEFERWVGAALVAPEVSPEPPVTLTLRIVAEAESATLNQRYRGREGATNVLSFPAELPALVLEHLEARPLGDLVLCAPLVAREAERQGKAVADHWAHLCVHGVLHLLGQDHDEPESAAAMESLETTILKRLGVPDPYR